MFCQSVYEIVAERLSSRRGFHEIIYSLTWQSFSSYGKLNFLREFTRRTHFTFFMIGRECRYRYYTCDQLRENIVAEVEQVLKSSRVILSEQCLCITHLLKLELLIPFCRDFTRSIRNCGCLSSDVTETRNMLMTEESFSRYANYLSSSRRSVL